MRSRVFRRPRCRRHARSTDDTYIIATPEVVAGRPLPIAKLQAMMLARTRATQRLPLRREGKTRAMLHQLYAVFLFQAAHMGADALVRDKQLLRRIEKTSGLGHCKKGDKALIHFASPFFSLSCRFLHKMSRKPHRVFNSTNKNAPTIHRSPSL